MEVWQLGNTSYEQSPVANRSKAPTTVVLVGGVFDLLHYGHLRFLKRAKEIGDYLVVAINTDDFVYRYKNKKPILTTFERLSSIKELPFVDKVIINETNEDWLPTIITAKPSIIVTTTEWQQKDYYKQMGVSKEQLDAMNIELKYIPHTKEISTTQIIQRINDQTKAKV